MSTNRTRASFAIVFLLMAGIAAAQTPAPQTQPQPNASVAPSKPGEFYDKDLDLHFNYPVEMRIVDAAAAMEAGHQNIYGVSGAGDPEHQEAKRCVRVLLDAELPENKAPQRPASLEGVWTENSKKPKDAQKPEPITATILMLEFVRDCVPEEANHREDDLLAGIALSFVSLEGVEPMPKPLWYEIGKQKIHMNSGAGRPEANGHVSPTPLVIMSMATQWRGHLLAWAFTSNDTKTFNELTKSLVQFGDGPWGPMFGANIGPKGQGTPITILPK